ncbi:hypothetical protein HPB51_009503 [Rhipicephalus microplus]|uniref:Uncharacterized protein n=1 Tax=Rhipicephalus microplus TaxID=6941 RepID=A0A9J6DU59_RHIMP|nr:hypothetical protein HPB51_009503 [Rhipicephalus microplus]
MAGEKHATCPPSQRPYANMTPLWCCTMTLSPGIRVTLIAWSKQKQEPPERKPRKRKYELYTGDQSDEEEKKKKPPALKPAPRPPPIVDYHTLLQLANTKQHEPVVIERLAPTRTEESRPLTKQEKERRLEEELHRKGVKLPSKFPPAKRKEGSEKKPPAAVNGKRPGASSDKTPKSEPQKSERERLKEERQRLMEEEERELQEMERRLAERRKEIARKQQELEKKEVGTI